MFNITWLYDTVIAHDRYSLEFHILLWHVLFEFYISVVTGSLVNPLRAEISWGNRKKKTRFLSALDTDIAVTSQWAHCRLKSSAYRLFAQPCSGSHQRKYQSSPSLAFARGIHRWPVDSPNKEPVTRKMEQGPDYPMYSLQHGSRWSGAGYQQSWYWPVSSRIFRSQRKMG